MTDKKPGKLSESPWMPHDLDAIADPKFQPLINKFKALGYAIYWRLNELLHQEPGNKLEVTEVLLDGLCGLFGCQPDEARQIIAYAISCKLYTRDGDFFYSERVLRNVKHRENLSEQRRQAGAKGGKSKAAARQKPDNSLANAKQNVAKRREEILPKGNISLIVSHQDLSNPTPLDPQPLVGLVSGWPYKSPGEKATAERMFANIHPNFYEPMLQDMAENAPSDYGIIDWLSTYEAQPQPKAK